MNGTGIALAAAACIASYVATGQFFRYAVAKRLVDVPNARSSHAVATPRGGGVAIVLTTLIALLVLGALGALPWRLVTGWAGAGLLVAFIGYADDRSSIAPRWRLLAHFGAAAWILWWQGGAPALAFLPDIAWLRDVLAAVYLVWLLNLTNFMDGIDGIASVEVITVCGGGVAVLAVAGAGAQTQFGPLALAGATLGFLFWNWPPAKIFMGDAGSGFLGLLLGAFSLRDGLSSVNLFWSWVILLGVFVVDATVTLVRRLLRGERVSEAHNSHAYQHSARRLGAHLPVTLTVGVTNVIGLLPIALLVALGNVTPLTGVVVAYVPLIAFALILRAGVR